jgi:hypothetical protein
MITTLVRLAVLVPGLLAIASPLIAQTIMAVEVESYFYAHGEMKHSTGQFENTYLVQKDKVIRTRVYDRAKMEVIPDETEYSILENLISNPAQIPRVGENRRPRCDSRSGCSRGTASRL